MGRSNSFAVANLVLCFLHVTLREVSQVAIGSLLEEKKSANLGRIVNSNVIQGCGNVNDGVWF